jgi:hypothetical protein
MSIAYIREKGIKWHNQQINLLTRQIKGAAPVKRATHNLSIKYRTHFLMTNYPEKTCYITLLVTHPKLVAATIAGTKTQQRRDGLYAYPNETFELEGITFVVTSVERQRIGDMTDADAKAEGYPDLESYKQIILRMHANMIWDENGLVWVHTFKRLN